MSYLLFFISLIFAINPIITFITDEPTKKLVRLNPANYELRENALIGESRVYIPADNDGWYFEIKGADPNTFETLGSGYFKDKKSVWFYLGIELPAANPDTFSVVSNDDEAYGKDDQYVWSGANLQFEINPSNCTLKSIELCSLR